MAWRSWWASKEFRIHGVVFTA